MFIKMENPTFVAEEAVMALTNISGIPDKHWQPPFVSFETTDNFTRKRTSSVSSDTITKSQLMYAPSDNFGKKRTSAASSNNITKSQLMNMAICYYFINQDKSLVSVRNRYTSGMGEITIELYWKHVPITCRNFAELTRRGYYNGTKFHRVIRDFMIQGGDPTGTGKGGMSIYGECFDDEIHDDLKHTGAGIISMANSGPDTNGSQFFITLAPTQWLDGKHTIFGRVCSGMAIVKRIALVETDKNDRPVDDIKIVKGTIKNA